MLQVLVDADMVLEALLNRSRFVADSEALVEIVQTRKIQGYICELGLEKIYSVASRLENSLAAEEVVCGIQAMMRRCPVDANLLQQARSLNIQDFESAVEVACAIAFKLGAIVTQKPEDFAGADLSVLSVNDLLERQRWQELLESSHSPILLVDNSPSFKNLSEVQHQPIENLCSPNLLNVSVVNTAFWLPDKAQNFQMSQPWTLVPKPSPVTNMRSPSRDEFHDIALQIQRDMGIEIPLEATGAYRDITVAQSQLRLYVMTWLVTVAEVIEWTLLFIFRVPRINERSQQIKVQISDKINILDEYRLELNTNESYRVTEVIGTQDEQFIVKIASLNQKEQTSLLFEFSPEQ
jgi:predicted nucleic acid-binding protein